MKMALLAAGAVVALAAPALAAEPIVLACSGSGLRDTDTNITTPGTPYEFSFELVVDAEARTVTRDRKAMKVWSWTDDELIVSSGGKGSLGSRFYGPELSISRRTGTFKTRDGSGRCELAATTQKLF